MLSRNYLTVVVMYKEACDGFLQQIEGTSECFTNLEGHYEFVEEKTRALQFACEKLLQEQVLDTHTRVCYNFDFVLSVYRRPLEWMVNAFQPAAESDSIDEPSNPGGSNGLQAVVLSSTGSRYQVI